VPDTYPIVMVRGDAHRQAFNDTDVIRLRFEGYRRADEPSYERGGFLPPPRAAAGRAETAKTEAEPAAETGDAKTSRRKTH